MPAPPTSVAKISFFIASASVQWVAGDVDAHHRHVHVLRRDGRQVEAGLVAQRAEVPHEGLAVDIEAYRFAVGDVDPFGRRRDVDLALGRGGAGGAAVDVGGGGSAAVGAVGVDGGGLGAHGDGGAGQGQGQQDAEGAVRFQHDQFLQ